MECLDCSLYEFDKLSLSLSGKSSFDASEAHSVVPLCLRFCFVSRTSLRYVSLIFACISVLTS